MKSEENFFNTVCNLAIPVALQSMLQASFSIIDQIMIGQLGTVNVAGVGFAGKFTSVFSVLVAAIGTVAGIMISQYMGQKNRREILCPIHDSICRVLNISAQRISYKNYSCFKFSLTCVVHKRDIFIRYNKGNYQNMR